MPTFPHLKTEADSVFDSFFSSYLEFPHHGQIPKTQSLGELFVQTYYLD
jgi:hypothetical protein